MNQQIPFFLSFQFGWRLFYSHELMQKLSTWVRANDGGIKRKVGRAVINAQVQGTSLFLYVYMLVFLSNLTENVFIVSILSNICPKLNQSNTKNLLVRSNCYGFLMPSHQMINCNQKPSARLIIVIVHDVKLLWVRAAPEQYLRFNTWPLANTMDHYFLWARVVIEHCCNAFAYWAWFRDFFVFGQIIANLQRQINIHIAMPSRTQTLSICLQHDSTWVGFECYLHLWSVPLWWCWFHTHIHTSTHNSRSQWVQVSIFNSRLFFLKGMISAFKSSPVHHWTPRYH